VAQVDDETQQLMDELFISKIRRARERSMSEKMLAGPKLFEETCERMRGGIRSQNPGFRPEEIEAELDRRLKIKRAIDEYGIYQDAGIIDE
jgi:hypothetical protein